MRDVAGPLRAVRDAFAANWSILVVIAAWEIVAHAGVVSSRLMPPVETIAVQLWLFARSGDLVYHASATLGRALSGFALAIGVGVPLGTLFARSRWFERLFEPTFVFGYPIPKVALYPIFILVFGFRDTSKIALIFLECVYPITLQTLVGMRAAERPLVWAAQNVGANRTQLFWHVLVPSAAPSIFAGVRIALPIAFILAIVTEILGGSRGLGYVVSFESASFDYARALAAVVVIGLIGFALDRTLVALRGRIIFWQRDLPSIT